MAAPPADSSLAVTIESSLIGMLMLRPELLVEIADQLFPVDFQDPVNQKIYQAISSLYKDNRDIDVLTVAAELSRTKSLKLVGGKDHLIQLTAELPTVTTSKEYAALVAAQSRRRGLIEAGQKISSLAGDQSKDTNQIVEEAEKRLFAISNRHVENNIIDLPQLLMAKFDKLEQLKSSPDALKGVSTGLKEMDRVLAGFHKSDLFILAARPAMGKTSFALNIAANIAARKQSVMFFSLEMSNDQLVERLLAIQSGIDAWKIRNADLTNADFARLNSAMSTLSESSLFIDDSVGLNISQLRTKVRRQHHKQPLSLVVVDYLQLMSGSQAPGSGAQESNRVYEIAEISRGLKLLARELDIPIMVLSQLNRAVENRDSQKPQLSDLRDSGAIEQDADVVAFLYRDDYYNPEKTKRPNIVDVLIKKHRNGPTANIEVYFNPDRQRYLDLDRRKFTPPDPGDDG